MMEVLLWGGENAVYVSAGGDDANNGSKEAPLKTIGEAYDKVADGGTIYLLSDIKIEGRLVLAQNKTVTIAGQDAGPAPVITYAKDGSTTTDLYVFEVGVETGAPVETSLTLRNVTVDAEAQDIRCIRVCSEGTLVLDEGTTVCNGRAVHRDGNTGCSDWVAALSLTPMASWLWRAALRLPAALLSRAAVYI